MKIALAVIDVQKGFMNPTNCHILGHIRELVTAAKQRGIPVLFSQFVNPPQSPFHRFLEWHLLGGPPETEIVPDLLPPEAIVVQKPGYTAFTEEFVARLSEYRVERLFLCGVATDGCVLKTALDAFERNGEPIVIRDACANEERPEAHEAALLVLERCIGAGRLKTAREVLAAGFR